MEVIDETVDDDSANESDVRFIQEKLSFIRAACMEDKKTFHQAFRAFSRAPNSDYLQAIDMEKALV